MARGLAKRRMVLLLAAALLAPAVGSAGPQGPATARAAECNGDECEAPPPAPEDPTPGTAVVEGPPNPPVHYPKVRCKRGQRRVVRKGVSLCVAKRHGRRAGHR